MRKTYLKILCTLVCMWLMMACCTAGIFADTGIMPHAHTNVTDDSSNAPLSPEAGTVGGSDNSGIGGAVSNAIDSVADGVSDAVSDVLDIDGSKNTSANNSGTAQSGTSANTQAADTEGGSMAAAIIIFIIIAIAIVVLVIVLIPKRRS